MDDAPLDVDVVRAAGAAVRSIHDASAGLPVSEDRLVFIDWGGAGPSTRLWDLAYAAVSFGHLFAAAEVRRSAARLAAFVDGYGADTDLRGALPESMAEGAGAMHDLLRRSHETGREPWASLYAQGHGRLWRDTTTFITEHLAEWRRAVARDVPAQ
ncbi:BUD32 family EKC/KEOPS complex subunit [Nocardioides pacificus]